MPRANLTPRRPGRRGFRGFALATGLTLAWGVAGRAQELSIDYRQASILVRALGYDARLREPEAAELHIAVVGRPDLPASWLAARAMTLALQGMITRPIQGRPVKVIQLAYAGAAAFATTLESDHVEVLYICGGLEPDLAALLELTRKRHILSIAGQPEQLAKGVSLGVFPVDGRPIVFVNLDASRKEGAAFTSEMLRLANVIR